MLPAVKFVDNLIYPWSELDDALVNWECSDLAYSKAIRSAESLAVAIKHQVDLQAEVLQIKPKALQEEVDKESEDARLISDIADQFKHSRLDKPCRASKLSLIALFEDRELNKERQLRFIRNSIMVEHATLGRKDFMEAAAKAIHFWAKKRNLPIGWQRSPKEAPEKFISAAELLSSQKYFTHSRYAGCQFLKRDEHGVLT